LRNFAQEFGAHRTFDSSFTGIKIAVFRARQCFPLWRLYLDVWQPDIIAFAEFTDICISWIMSVKMKWWDIYAVERI